MCDRKKWVSDEEIAALAREVHQGKHGPVAA